MTQLFTFVLRPFENGHAHAGIIFISVVTGAVMLALLLKRRIRRDAFIALENAGLYWHLVDIIWIFLLPLFYLAA